MLCLAVLKLYKAMHSWQKIKESNPSEVIQQPGSPPACPLAGRGLCGGGPPASAVLIWEREAVRNLASADEASVAQSRLGACVLPRESCSALGRERRSQWRCQGWSRLKATKENVFSSLLNQFGQRAGQESPASTQRPGHLSGSSACREAVVEQVVRFL